MIRRHMRPSLSIPIRLASISLLATFVGCSDNTGTPAGSDAGTDVVTTTDTPAVDAPVDTTPADAPADVPVDTPPKGECGFISPTVRAHATSMATAGWGALNRSRSMMMFGCNGAANARGCLANVPLVSDADIGANRSAIPTAHLRLLYTETSRSNFWTRSSADGRFVGRGIYLRDLARDAAIRATGAMYDPAFFPDNSGFIYQPGGRMCPMTSLTMGTPSAVAITGASSPCAGSSVGLYQHLGASLDGADFWATSAGTAAWDDGGHSATLTETRRNETWGATASTSLTLMANSGSGFTAVGTRNVTTPYQGDAVISPSSRLLITRFVDEAGAYQGYILNRLDAMHTGPAIMATATEVGRYCIQGAKPAFSFDERYVTYHHYVGGGPTADQDAQELGFADSADPGFAEYSTRGASNIYLLDLTTGRSVRVTNMGPGQYALYPHFRSDGWIYFIVRSLGTQREQVIASDAALLQ
jgi:hypothetical protein